jgi:hypothetical protein
MFALETKPPVIVVQAELTAPLPPPDPPSLPLIVAEVPHAAKAPPPPPALAVKMLPVSDIVLSVPVIPADPADGAAPPPPTVKLYDFPETNL